MKITIRLIISLLIGAALVVLVFSYVQARGEQKRLDEELSLRAAVLAKSFKEAIEPFIEQTEQPNRIKKFIEKFQGHKRLIGIIVDLKDIGRITLPAELGKSDIFQKELVESFEQGMTVDINSKWDERNVNFFTVPLVYW